MKSKESILTKYLGKVYNEEVMGEQQENNTHCSKCKYLLVDLEGYSDYTVEEVYHFCLKNYVKFNSLTLSAKYIDNNDVIGGDITNCPKFKLGTPITISVDEFKNDLKALQPNFYAAVKNRLMKLKETKRKIERFENDKY